MTAKEILHKVEKEERAKYAPVHWYTIALKAMEEYKNQGEPVAWLCEKDGREPFTTLDNDMRIGLERIGYAITPLIKK